jgi:hypothetical protein
MTYQSPKHGHNAFDTNSKQSKSGMSGDGIARFYKRTNYSGMEQNTDVISDVGH